MRAYVRVCALALTVLCVPRVSSSQDSLSGTWQAELSDGAFWVSLSIREKGVHTSHFVRLTDLPDGAIDLMLDREPGVMRFEGTRRGERAAGFFTWTPKDSFNKQVVALGFDRFDFDQLFFLTAVDATVSEIRRVRDLGYDRLTNDELFSMHLHGALSEHIQAMRAVGFNDLSVDELLSTRIHDVTPEFIQQVRQLGIAARGIDDFVSMRIHDVTPDYVEDMRDAGYPSLSVDELVSMRIHDITPEYVRDINALLDPN